MSSSFAMVTGVLHAKPSPWTTNKGKDLTTFRLKVGSVSIFDVWECIVFEKTLQDEILALAKGDFVSAVGSFTSEVAEYGGKPRVKHKLNVSRILVLETRHKIEGTPNDNDAEEVGFPDWTTRP